MPDVYIISDAFTDATLGVEAGYSFGPGPSPYTAPVLISPPAPDGGQQASHLTDSNTFGPFGYGGNIFQLISTENNTVATNIHKSTDQGATWAALDAAAAPPWLNGTGYFDGVDTVIMASRTDNAGDGTIILQDFDLVTETWGATYGAAGAPTTRNVRTIWKRPDGTLLIIYQSRSAFPGDGSTGLGCAIYNPTLGSWVTTFDAGAGLLALAGWDASQTLVTGGRSSSYMDDTGAIGVFFNTSSVQIVPEIWINRCFFQKIELDNTLGTFTDFPGQVQPLTAGRQDLEAYSGSPLGRPAVLTDQDLIVLPVLMANRNSDPFPQQIACLYIGTPISAPVWSVDNTKSIDPEVFIDDFIWPQEWGSIAVSTDGTTLYVVFSAQLESGQNFGRIRLCQTTNLTSPADGWTAATAFDLSIDAPPGFQFTGQSLLVPSVGVPGSPTPPPIVPGALKITLRGVRRVRIAECDTDQADRCNPEPQKPKIDRVW